MTQPAAVFERLRVDAVVDAGAHLGQFGRLAREAGYAGDILSFEPVLAVFAALVKGETAADPRWQAHRLALGSEDGTRALNVARSTDFSSFLEPSERSLAEFGGFSAVERREAVPVRRLDGVLPGYLPGWDERRIFLKLDTQGSELEILRGAQRTLEHVVAVQVELPVAQLYVGAPPREAIVAELGRHGFAEVATSGVTHDAHGEPLEVDCLLERRAA